MGGDFRELGEGDKFTWHQFHIHNWGARYFKGHALVTMHNNTGHAVPLTWILLNSQLTVELIANAEMLVNISTEQGKDSIRVYCNNGVNIVEGFGNLPGYVTAWYKPTGIANILTMSKAMKKFRVFF